ncbi:UNVERIFIED_CONTAM: hypothetical protein Sindi_1215700 [Sesamum indicum]
MRFFFFLEINCNILIETRYDILMVDLISKGQTPVLTAQSSICLFQNASAYLKELSISLAQMAVDASLVVTGVLVFGVP